MNKETQIEVCKIFQNIDNTVCRISKKHNLNKKIQIIFNEICNELELQETIPVELEGDAPDLHLTGWNCLLGVVGSQLRWNINHTIIMQTCLYKQGEV